MSQSAKASTVAAESLLTAVAEQVAGAGDLEGLTRPLLNILQRLTGLDSVYLTAIDWQADQQQILFSQNSGDMTIGEGLVVPWHDTLCRRALDENRFLTTDVPVRWGDSEAARALNIQTYASVPVKADDGEIFGTLCGASDHVAPVPEGTESVMSLFAQLVAHQIQLERAASHARQRARQAEDAARSFQGIAALAEQCSGATVLEEALHGCAGVLDSIWTDVTVRTCHPADEGPAKPVVRAFMNWLIGQQLTPDGAGWWNRRDDPDVFEAAGELVGPDIVGIGVACAMRRGQSAGSVLVLARALPSQGLAAQQMLTGLALHLSLLVTRLELRESLEASYREIERQARLDPLTALPNRRQLEEEGERLRARAVRHGGRVCAAFVDLDGFKQINDDHGHDAGDRFLMQVAVSLQTVTRAEEICARYGGDEFVLLALVPEHEADAFHDAVRDRLEEAVRGHYDLGDASIDYPGASVGVTIQASAEESLADLLVRADEAMYEVKRRRRGEGASGRRD
ncbi:sensor domain-containing diguanylate cyclase [Salinisphaera sp. P385]|uniref:diguanylate cyclase n=1 Tax=Spectribacter acetivorans TaxID=3075603 RepID=A0ABU3BBD0_9GAMM|nr:sensor domain-containing diguanylate cyclase [Salinisphaera sp. P385]MDT0618286.1 sensor domain-containing diguanylate cyclase [Salinisphaera sp. P385]